MMINIPKDVSFILDELLKNGHTAYIVGGCVRDCLMNKTPYDWDITTSAKPDKIIEIFKNFKIIDSGIKHGTIAVIINSNIYEITTYRCDGEYLDNRHPKAVTFVDNLAEDLKRRDFTINAMAYNEKSGLIDLYGGVFDIQNKIIKCVGNPDKRFREDALRIMRALRFSATLSFNIEENTKESIKKNFNLLENIAKERINTEFTKLLLSNDLSCLLEFSEIFKVCDKEILKISNLSKDLSKRLFAFILYSKYEINDLKRFHFDNKTIKQVKMISNNYYDDIENSTKAIRYKIKELHYQTVLDIVEIKKIFENEEYYKDIETKYKNIVASNMCQRIDELAINGQELCSIGIPKGKQIGDILEKLVIEIIENNLENDKFELLEYVQKEIL